MRQIADLESLLRSTYGVLQYGRMHSVLGVYQICDTTGVSLSYALSYDHCSRKFSLSWLGMLSDIDNIAVKFQVGVVHERKP